MFNAKMAQKSRLLGLLERKKANGQTYREWLKSPEAKVSELSNWLALELGAAPVRGVLETIEAEIKYAGYLSQQERLVAKMRRNEERRIPDGFAYAGIPGLSIEVREKLERIRPDTLGQASRIPGVTPAAILVLDVYLHAART